MLATRNTYTWIQKYIFPGGLLLDRGHRRITERHTQPLRTVDMLSLRPHYAETLRLWRERFRRDAVAALGFDDVFAAMWELYLAYSEAGFGGHISTYQWTFAPTEVDDELRRRLRRVAGDPGGGCTASPSSSGASAATTSSTSRGVWVSSRWPRSPPALGTGDLFRRSCCWPRSRCGPGGLAHVRQVGGKGEDPATAICWTATSRQATCAQDLRHPGGATWFVRCRCSFRQCGADSAAWWPVLIAGVVLWGVGVAFEAVGDHQLRRFKSDPGTRRGDGPGPVGMDAASQLFWRRACGGGCGW